MKQKKQANDSSPRRGSIPMSIAQALLPEFDQEMATTRRLLTLVPDDKATWKAHPKSFSIGTVAGHLANLPVWARITMQQTEFDVNPPSGQAFVSPPYESAARNIEHFDRNVADARAILADSSDQDFMV